jgi:GT2 family glycosyltransferase/Flp pilus assembly protein TadD
MSRRYLFGPITPAYVQQNLRQPCQDGSCLAFDASGATGLAVGPDDRWEDLQARLPPGWQPDFVVLYMAYMTVPDCFWSAPVPLIGLAPDGNLLWHYYRKRLPHCDLVVTDSTGVQALAKEGVAQARSATLFACEQAFIESPWPEEPRDCDVLFVGNLHPAVQRERLAWLGRLARLGDRWRVTIHTGIFGEDYRRLLGRSRIIFNRSIRGECNRRAFEVTAAGALLMQEEGNQEVPKYFRDRQECVYYCDDNLEELLNHYLEHEEERRSIAEAGRARVRQFSFEALWQELIEQIDNAWPDLIERVHHRPRRDSIEELRLRTWQALGSHEPGDPNLILDLNAALATQPRSAELHNALGLAEMLEARGRGPTINGQPAQAADHFQRAVESDPAHLIAGLNLVEALVGTGRTQQAVDQARRTLAALDRPAGSPATWQDAGRFPPGYDLFRVEWERSAWETAGKPAEEARRKRDLIRWRLHALLADLTGELVHFHEAALARPDLPITRAALGCALGRARRPADAVPHLSRAVTDNPFDLKAAHALFLALGEARDTDGQRRLARDLRLLAKAAPGVLPAEPWFTEAAPVGDEMASIIILCCNEVEYTRLCLESVLRHTRSPYELILVDNASTDSTAEYLEELRSRSGPARVEVIHNEKNLGFPGGCNQGIAKAGGHYLVFLNNDTIVSEGWLEGLVGWGLHDWPHVGLVGAVTNSSRSPQQIPVDYAGLDGFDAFAARRRRDYARQAQRAERLTGFCLLVRREVLDRVGGFDENYGSGFFDDDDLCVRALKAGFQLLVALNVYIHHFGSRTFTALGINCEEQLKHNFELFKAKWGPEQSAGYRLLPAAIVTAPSSGGRARVSLCLIVKNEESNLPSCLGSAADLVDEIVVVDTGSTDHTKDVAARFGARVFEFPWCDSFAAARNESLRHATGEWIFWLDADDRLDEDNRRKLRNLFGSLNGENAAYAMKCLCLPDQQSGSSTVVDHIRLFRNHPNIRFQHRVHEQILASVRQAGSQIHFTEVAVHHTGYRDAALRRKKLERDMRLLELENAESPDHPFTLFNLGCSLQELGRHAEALEVLRRSLARSQPDDSIVRKLYGLIAGCHRARGEPDLALAACVEGRQNYPDDTELLFVEGVLRREQGDLDGAIICLERLFTSSPGPHFGSVDAGLRGYKGRHNLAVAYHQQQRPAEAEAQWRQAVAERPEFVPAWLGLADLFLVQLRWSDFEALLHRLDADPHAALEAAVLRARGHMARKEFASALELLHRVTFQHPRAVWPQVILSHALLQECKDLAAAEQALRDVLTLDPGHPEARHNLSLLLRNQNRPSDEHIAAGRSLASLYHAACSTPSDIHVQLPKLFELASQCRHVTQLGTRAGISTTALLFAQPDELVSYDRVKHPHIDLLRAVAGRTLFHFRKADVLEVQIDETDLLFIDTRHTFEQLREELNLHAPKVRKYLVLHGTAAFAERGEAPGSRGLWPAVEEFLALGTFRLRERLTNNQGLTVLEAVRPATGVEGADGRGV